MVTYFDYIRLRPYRSVHANRTTFSRCFQNTMYIDIGKWMYIKNTCHNGTIICIESFFCIVYTLYSTTVLQ